MAEPPDNLTHASPRNDANAWPALIRGTLLGTVMFFVGYQLCVGDHTNYGLVMFLAMPFASGLVIGMNVERPGIAFASTISSILLSLLILVATGFEGYICCFMAFPLLWIGNILGTFAGMKWRGNRGSPHNVRRKTLLILIFAPLFSRGRPS